MEQFDWKKALIGFGIAMLGALVQYLTNLLNHVPVLNKLAQYILLDTVLC